GRDHALVLSVVHRVIVGGAAGNARDYAVAGIDAGSGHAGAAVDSQASGAEHDVGAYGDARVVHYGVAGGHAVHDEVGIERDLQHRGAVVAGLGNGNVGITLEGDGAAVADH